MRMQFIICPYLKGSCNGAICGVKKTLIKEMENISIKLCMNRHYEVCAYYRMSLLSDDTPVLA
jgi:hypothetical protein